jgi:type I restriction enzyme, S subunit
MQTKEKQNIPGGWQEKRLGDVCNIINGSTPQRSVSEYWDNGNIPWFTVDDIRSNGRIIRKTNQSITDRALRETSVKLLPEDSVLLCCTASLGEVALTKIPLTTNQQFNGLVSKDKKNLFPYYLFYSAQKVGETLKSKSGKTTINFLSVGSLSKEKVLIPPIKEQQKIAEILGAVDEDIAKTQEVIKATEKLKRGLMRQLFTRGIGHTGFNNHKLGDLCIFQTGKLNSNRAVVGGEYPFFTCSQETFAIDRYSFDQRAILLAGNNAAGKYSVKYYEGKFDAYQRTYVISVKDENNLSYHYLREVLNTRLNELRDASVGSSTKFLTLKLLQNLPISLPAIKEQRKIAEILSSVDEKITVNKKLKEKLTLLKKGLMQDLLSGRVRTNHFFDVGKMIK